MKTLLKDKDRMLIIGLALAVVMSVVGYAMTVNNFTDYNPPEKLTINWHDYWSSSSQSAPSANNAVTNWPRWSAEYPYRAILLGATKRGTAEQGYETKILVIYSKTASTSEFTFEYIDFDRKTVDRTGYIRMRFPKTSYGHAQSGEDLVVLWSGGSDMTDDTLNLYQPSNYPVYGYPYYIGDDVYFDFDFYYQCADKHQQGASNLNISGLKSIANVPYAYILSCNEHGNSASSGSSSSGGGSSGGGGVPGYEWGDGEYGGGVNNDKISSIDDGGGYSSRPDMELSVPDDWREPWYDDYNSMPSEYVPDFPEYVPSDGDTGQTGENWELPALDINNDGVSGEASGYKEFNADGEQGLIGFAPGVDGWGYMEFQLDGQYGLIDFAEWGR